MLGYTHRVKVAFSTTIVFWSEDDGLNDVKMNAYEFLLSDVFLSFIFSAPSRWNNWHLFPFFVCLFPMIPASMWKTRDSHRSNRGTALADKHPSLGAGLKQICLVDLALVLLLEIVMQKKKEKKVLIINYRQGRYFG